MKYCSHCGKELFDDARFCDACGTQADDRALEQEKEFLQQTLRFLKYERLCGRIVGIILLVFALLFIGISLIWLALSFQMHFENGRIGMAFAFALYLLYGLLVLPFAIVNLVMAKKVTKHMNAVYTDPRPTLTRCGSAAPLVLAIFFNNIALIFIIINLIRVKSNRSLVERIIARYTYR